MKSPVKEHKLNCIYIYLLMIHDQTLVQACGENDKKEKSCAKGNNLYDPYPKDSIDQKFSH